MKPATRTRLLRWLFIFGPTASLILCALGWLVMESSAGEAFRSALARASAMGPLRGGTVIPNFTFAAAGWLLLTLGCSAGTCLRTFRHRGKAGATLVVLVVLGTPLLAFTHVVLALSILFSGCVAIYGPIRS